MKRVKQKNQIIVTLLALLIAVSGYLHFVGKEAQNIENAVGEATQKPLDDGIKTTIGQISTEDIENKNETPKTAQPKETQSAEKLPDSSKVGQAVLVNTTVNADYFYTAKLGREQVRAKNTETLMEIVNNSELTDKQKESAAKEIINITKTSEMENNIENLLAAKGFENTVVSVGEDGADVVVDVSTITLEQAAIIEDVVMRKTGFSSGKIVITPINGE